MVSSFLLVVCAQSEIDFFLHAKQHQGRKIRSREPKGKLVCILHSIYFLFIYSKLEKNGVKIVDLL